MAVQVLSHLGVKFKGVDVLADPAIRQGIKISPIGRRSRSSISTVNSSAAPTSSARCIQTGELENLLHEQGVPHSHHH